MKKILLILICTVIVLMTGCSQRNIKFGTSGEGGTYGEVALALADSVNRNKDSISFDIRSTAGSAANVRLLSQNYLDMAIAQADIIDNAYNSTGIFALDSKYRGYAAVAGLYTKA